jgi:5-methylcytosine-specific restriction endonuclease McrA
VRTLVLNKQYVPVAEVDWRRGFTLAFCQKADVLEFYEHIVRTPTQEFFVPAVIVLRDYAKVPKAKVTYSKRVVFERDDYTCQYCQKKLCHQSATIDHIIPRSKGGQTTFDNTVTSCFRCNNKKGQRLLNQTNFKLANRPEAPSKAYFSLRYGRLAEEWLPYIPKSELCRNTNLQSR